MPYYTRRYYYRRPYYYYDYYYDPFWGPYPYYGPYYYEYDYLYFEPYAKLLSPLRVYYYNCDGINDSNWGCGWRCVQMILYCNGKEVPSLRKLLGNLLLCLYYLFYTFFYDCKCR